MVDHQGRFDKCQRPGITPDQLNQNRQEVPTCWPPLPISDLTASLQGQGSLQPLFPAPLVYPPHSRPRPPDCATPLLTPSVAPIGPGRKAIFLLSPPEACRGPPAGQSGPGVLSSGLSSGTSTFQLPHWTQSLAPEPPSYLGREEGPMGWGSLRSKFHPPLDGASGLCSPTPTTQVCLSLSFLIHKMAIMKFLIPGVL